MPINRNDKHWCDPGSETPSARSGTWTCPDCKTRWKFWPDLNTWAEAKEDLTPLVEAGKEVSE